MSRRHTQHDEASLSPCQPLDTAEDDFADDEELARELEEERRKLLAASSNGDCDLAVNSEEDQDDDGVVYGDDDGEDDDMDVDHVADEDDSADEWQPPQPAARATRQSQRKRARRASSTDDSGDDGDDGDDDPYAEVSSDTELAPVPKKSKASPNKKSKKNTTSNRRSERSKIAADRNRGDDDDDANDSFDEEAERVQAEAEAAAAWADVRKRKETAAASQASTSNTAARDASKPPSLSAWLGKGPSASSSVSELASSLPMPTTCAAAQIVDRNSLFVGYVYPLTTASSAYISTLLSHLTRVVHPTVAVDLLPPQFANAPATKRGASHDMYAYRVLELKRGRSGLAGPDDFSLQEDKEDDGEKWGGERVLRVAREQGASDVLVVVSRWYGGELLGPARFEHIQNAASAALQQHMHNEEVEELRMRIQHLDRKIAQWKAKLKGEGANAVEIEAKAYADLTVERGQRLWLARQKALDALQKRAANVESRAAQTSNHGEQAASAAAPDVAQASAESEAIAPDDVGHRDGSNAVEMESETADGESGVESEPKPKAEHDADDGDDSATGVISGAETYTHRVAKPEPGELAIKSEAVETPIRVKSEPDDPAPLPPPPPPPPAVASISQPVKREPGNRHVKLEPTAPTPATAEEEADDLSGWDELG